MGGLALPKVSKCRDVYGQSHKELGEGNDDLRQDAVMEQVFELCNSILQRDQETRRRRLTMRCYKVVPLAAQAGVLQFVTNTAPLNAWIPSAHARYHPDDIPTRIVQKQLKDTQEMCTGKSPQHPIEYLTSWFAEIVTKRHRPVMRYFFREKHKEPTAWFATRLNYTRSVAVTSIVGHVLGLGDRHLSNILLDQHNGEVVHIDLGIAFDQGRVLPVPEKVPFRLTRDMVDGMGASGTQGVFQRCAEETLRVLRGGSEIILAVLEVFKHDPLHSWTANEHKLEKIQRDAGVAAEKARRRKKEQEKKANASAADAYLRATGHDLDLDLDLDNGTSIESADRALMSVARKLDGSLSVEFTVNELIAEATDMQNLATIFTGWSPHC
uniref:Serine/threonine-protein kinase TEL1 n=1 Tax=Schizophyllum commune (strain H4-8 / FGSC 9210) TaxID=578458 RepID=D8Q186_SCHCM